MQNAQAFVRDLVFLGLELPVAELPVVERRLLGLVLLLCELLPALDFALLPVFLDFKALLTSLRTCDVFKPIFLNFVLAGVALFLSSSSILFRSIPAFLAFLWSSLMKLL